MEEDDEEIVIKRPKTPLSNRNRRLTIETPEVDLERFRPQRFNLDATNPLVSTYYYTLLFYNIETWKKGPSLIFPSSIAKN